MSRFYSYRLVCVPLLLRCTCTTADPCAAVLQCFFLTRRHRRALADMGAASYHFEQHEDETVYVPAGCPHQVPLTRPMRITKALRLRDSGSNGGQRGCQ